MTAFRSKPHCHNRVREGVKALCGDEAGCGVRVGMEEAGCGVRVGMEEAGCEVRVGMEEAGCGR